MVPAGFRFRPTEEELIKLFLLKKVRGEELPWDGIPEGDLYGKKAPWEMFDDDLDESEEKHYLFTKLKRVKSRVARLAGCGTWHESCGQEVYEKQSQKVIGFNKLFSFKVREGSHLKKSNWIMHEFSLAGASLVGERERSSDWVLCTVIKKGLETKRRMNLGIQVSNTESAAKDLLLLGKGFQDLKRTRYSIQSDELHATKMPKVTPSTRSVDLEEDNEAGDVLRLTDLETHLESLSRSDNLRSFESKLPVPRNSVGKNRSSTDLASPKGRVLSPQNADPECHAPNKHLSPSSSPEKE